MEYFVYLGRMAEDPIVDPVVKALQARLDEHLETIIYTKTHPRYEGPIEGEKLKRLNITIVHQPATKRYWVEQDGNRIGDYFYYGELSI